MSLPVVCEDGGQFFGNNHFQSFAEIVLKKQNLKC